jgi:hypothetical protein
MTLMRRLLGRRLQDLDSLLTRNVSSRPPGDLAIVPFASEIAAPEELS